jgi:hypothetical protein
MTQRRSYDCSQTKSPFSCGDNGRKIDFTCGNRFAAYSARVKYALGSTNHEIVGVHCSRCSRYLATGAPTFVDHPSLVTVHRAKENKEELWVAFNPIHAHHIGQFGIEMRRQKAIALIGPGRCDFVEVLANLPGE